MIGKISFHFEFRPYMKMYLVVNVANMKLYDPPMIMDEDESIQVLEVDDFSPMYLDEMYEYAILNRRVRTLCRGDVEYICIGLKEMQQKKRKVDRKQNCEGVVLSLIG